MGITLKRDELPYHIRRLIRQYRADYQAEITRVVRAMLATGKEVKAEEIGAAAIGIIIGWGNPERDERAMEELSLKAYHAGNFKYLDELVAEWRHELQTRAS